MKNYHGCYPDDWFIRVLSIGVVILAVVLMMVGNGWGYTTWQEAYNSGVVKYDGANYALAIPDFQSALTLAKDDYQKAGSQLKIGFSYYNLSDNTNAILELSKVIPMETDVATWNCATQSQLFIGVIQQERLNDNTNAILSYTKTLILPCANIVYKEQAFTRLKNLKADFNLVKTTMGIPTNWSGFYYRAKVKTKLTDYVGALLDGQEALKLTGQNDGRKECLQLREDICMDGFGMTYSDYVKGKTP